MNTRRFFLAQYLPLRWSEATLLGLVCAVGLWLFGPKTAICQDSVQRDQQAITILTQTIAAGGGQQLLTSIQDLTETGTAAYNFAESVTGNVTVKLRGERQLRIDADLPKGKRTTVVNGGSGSLIETDGKRTQIYRESANILGSFTLPYLPLLAAMQDLSTSIIYGGLVTHNGASAYDIRLQKVYAKQQAAQGGRGQREARDFYIDPKTFLVDSILDRIHFGANPKDEGQPHETLYSNYQSESGIMSPMTIVESVRGTTWLTMNLNQVTVNSGLADSDFAW